MINSFVAHRILDDDSTEELESFLDYGISRTQKQMRGLERYACSMFSIFPK